MSDVTQVMQQLAQMKQDRQPSETMTRECFEHSFPERADGWTGEIVDGNTVQGKLADLLDPTATDSGRILAANIQGGMVPSNSLWFGMDTGPDTEAEGKAWLQDAANTIFQNIHASNFDAETHECILDMIGGGAFAQYIDVDRNIGGYIFEQWPLSQCYFSSSKLGGRIDIIAREYELTALQACNQFEGSDGGNKGVSTRTRTLCEKTPDAKVRMLHMIQPRKMYVPGSVLSKNLPFASCHIELDAKHECRESGYHEFPVAVPRWRRLPRSQYAVGPMADALPAAKMLNKLWRMELTSADIAISGMWIAEDDGVLNPRTIKIGPRKVIVANSVDSMKPLTTGANFQLSEMLVQRIQDQIRKLMMADQLPPQDGPVRTAAEIHARIAILRQMLGPMYGRLQSEWLQGLIERCFGLAYRAGVLGQAPQSIQNRKVTIRYISPLARSQKLEEVSAIDQYIEGTINAAQAFPEALDSVDIDEAQQFRGEALGVPHKVIRTMDQILQHRQMKNQAQAQAQQQAMTQQVGMTAAEATVKQAAAA